jgi:hypothetical protein
MEVTALKGSSGDVQHFADRIIAGRGVRYGRVAMVPISAKMKRRPKVYLTIETPVIACRFRVKSAVLAGGVSLRVYPDQRTFLEPVGMSQTWLEAAALRSRLTFRTG